MSNDELTLQVIDALTGADVPYMLVGSLSSNYYGVVRATKDADFVIELGDRRFSEITERLGPHFRVEPQMSFETVTMTTRRILTVVDNQFQIELFSLSDDEHDRERFRRRRRLNYLGRSIWLPTAEDVIITKLTWLFRNPRGKDRDDVRDVLAVQRDALDFAYIHSWCDRHGTRALLDEIRASIPKID
jgi:hypothetical protein